MSGLESLSCRSGGKGVDFSKNIARMAGFFNPDEGI